MQNEETDDAREFFELRDHFLELADKISEKYKVGSKIRAVNLLLRHVCERCIIELLGILVRVETGHVVTFRTEEWREFLKHALQDRIAKAERILEGKAMLVPGEDCAKCPLTTCRFNRYDPKTDGLTKPENLTRLMENFRENIYPAIENAVRAVLEECKMETDQFEAA